MTSITGQWSILRAGGGGNSLEVPSLPLTTTTPAGPIRLAIGPHDEPRMLVPLSHGDRPQQLKAGPALHIGVSMFTYKGRTTRFLDLMCVTRELEGVFAEVVDEILARIAASTEVLDAVSRTLEDFRALLVPQFLREPDRARVAGLIAELIILNRLLDLSTDAWRAWRGPTGDRHDFRVRDMSLEVKASLHAGTNVVTINGLEQLEPPSGGTLHLLHMFLEPVDGGLLTVSTLGGQLLAKVDDPSSLHELLVAVGCYDVHDEGWNRHAFRLEAEELFDVTSEFPRIAPSRFADGRIPSGVVDATYQIDLTFAESSKLAPVELEKLLQRFASDPNI